MFRRVALFLIALLSLQLNAFAQSKDLHLLSANGLKSALDEILPHGEHATGMGVSTLFNSASYLSKRIDGGEAFDVAILPSDVLDRYIAQGKLVASSRAEVARVGLGIGIRAGSPKPDLHSPEALKKTLLAAKAITLNKTGASAPTILALFDKLGIAEQVKPKLMLETVSGQAQKNVADGKADLVLILLPELLVDGVDVAGPLPKELQTYLNFSAAVSTSTSNPEAAKKLIQFITAADHTAIFKAKGAELMK